MRTAQTCPKCGGYMGQKSRTCWRCRYPSKATTRRFFFLRRPLGPAYRAYRTVKSWEGDANV